MNNGFTGLVVRENESFYSICIELNIASQGETIEEARNNLKDAVELYFDTSVDYNLPLNCPVPDEDNPLINDKENVADKFLIKVNLNIFEYA